MTIEEINEWIGNHEFTLTKNSLIKNFKVIATEDVRELVFRLLMEKNEEEKEKMDATAVTGNKINYDIAENKFDLPVVLDKGAYMPERAHEWDAGADLRCPVYTVVPAHGEAHIDLGVHIAIPEGYYGRLESKSGLNFKGHVDIPGGIIDSGFTGSIKTVVNNRSDKDYIFNAGDKVCQIIIQPCECCTFYEVEELAKTERGNSGFGSTGK